MANTLTGLIPTMYNALNVVSRELVGFIPAVTQDMTYERAAVGQTVKSPVAPAATATDIAPAVTAPNDGDQVIGSIDMVISKSRRVPIRWNGEEKKGVDNNGAQFNVIFRDQMAQAMRTLTNEIEADLAALHLKASRAYGTVGTTPFATNTKEVSQVRKILVDNGSPTGDLQLVLDTDAGANLRTLYGISTDKDWSKVPVGEVGVLATPHGMSIRESGQILMPAAGSAAGATTNAAGYAKGATVITLASAGTGAILSGDIITFAGDSNMYVVASGDADVSNGGTITLAAPGLREAIGTAAANITVVSASPRSMGFARSAIALATRAPALPDQGDSAADSFMLTDPVSGLSFEVRMYNQYRQVQYEVSMAWGCQMIKPEHCALLLG
ncbi:P22 coat - protein 5 family protein [Shewanella fodinae]|uniref:P22 coat - protein 5 family protein n=1 Tax=Shewanella fodinae TaxID=552357 RepID=UPI0016770933|nr:P22 coat - protein 5 family protein [Shewanella fodinae]MCL2905224.1 hypothetical protein [Shewanella fodinae]GGY87646.1 hypothetical protein GCM10007169_01000 [Shewanella fodinae]